MNNGNAQHIIRGGVYITDLDTPHIFEDAYGNRKATHLLMRKRPYIVISNNNVNKSLPVVQVIPCVYVEDGGTDTSVEVQVDSNSYYARCDQLTSIDADKLSAKQFYGVLDEDTMSDIEAMVRKQLCLEYQETDLEKLLLNIESALSQLEDSKKQEVITKANMDKQLQNTMQRVADKVSSSKYAGMSAVEKFNKKYNLNATTISAKPKVSGAYTDDEKKAMVEKYLRIKSTPNHSAMMDEYAGELGYATTAKMQQSMAHYRKYLENKGVM